MRILTVTNLYPNPYQPTRATFNREQLRALHQQHPVRVISPIAWTDELPARLKVGNKLPHNRRTHLDDITVAHPHYWYTPKLFRSQYGRFYKHSITRAFEEAINEFHPDIVLAPWAYPDGYAAVKLAHQHNLPCVIKVHGCDLLVQGKGLKHYPGRYKPTVEAIGEADAIVGVSQHLADTAIELGVEPERIRVVYDGVDDNHFHPGSQTDARRGLDLDPETPVILFVGQLVNVKGIDTLISACAILAQRHVEFRTLLIGEGPLREQLQNQINALHLQDRVKLIGGKPHHQLPHYFRAATTFVLPSHSEGVPCVLLESAACGTPFVASRVGGIPEIAHLVESRLVPPRSPEQLAAAIHEIIIYRAANPKVAQATIRTHTDAAAEIATLFEELLGSSDPTKPLDDRPRIRPKLMT
ncbi:MAG TPA: glycosyltransferase [Tepidisphaeraceae bacterium]|jgi:glycosyltransferase involved in cell wall biosynthesis